MCVRVGERVEWHLFVEELCCTHAMSNVSFQCIVPGSLTEEDAQNFTLPTQFVKSAECPGCYECREVPLVPNTNGNYFWQVYGRYQGSSMKTTGFNIKLSDPGSTSAILTVSLPEPVKGTSSGNMLTWGGHNPEFICRVDPRTAGPAEPDLIDDEGWTTFLLPDGTEEGGDNEGSDPNHDDVINAIAAGFHPPEAVQTFESTNQANLAAVFPPGEQLDPSVTEGPWHSSSDWDNLTATAVQFTVPATTLDGGRGGGHWPPRPTVKVTFMPIPVQGENHWRWYPKEHASFDAVTELRDQSTNSGWHIDSGAVDADHTHSVTGETLRFGWRCPASIGWFDSNWNEKNGRVFPVSEIKHPYQPL